MKIGSIHYCCLGLGMFAFLLLAVNPCAGEDLGESAVEDGRRALNDSTNYPWYDDKNDGVRRIEVEDPDESETTKSPASGQPTSAFSGGNDWFTPLAWIGIALLVGLVVYLLVRAYLVSELRSAGNRQQDAETAAGDVVDNIENLPVKIGRTTTDLLGEAQAQYAAGNYGEAIVYLYSHQLVRLDRHQLIRLTKGKTNRQYLHEIAALQQLRTLVEQTMILFEDVFFGRRSLSRDRFESVWRRLDEFDHLVQQTAGK
ncbi:MAG: DUF4129 domain-containing protein [Planctomycetales bacterium]